MSLVLDASATLSWLYQDEKAALADAILRRVIADGAWVPSLWRLEVANGLRTGMRRSRIDRNYRDQALTDLGLLKIVVDPDTDKNAWTSTLQLSDRLGLTPYDAAYLELAQRRSLPLAALDAPLCAAAAAVGIAVVGLDP